MSRTEAMDLRRWATERERMARDERAILSVCARCGIVLGTKPGGLAGGGTSHGIGRRCAEALYPELVGRL